MGCGSSRAMPAVPENLLPASTGESSRRRKNAGGKHSHLQNAIDESVDALTLFRQYAIQNKQPLQDWKAFAHDDHDNFGESALREAATQMAQVEELQSQAHVEYIRGQNAHISTMREILQELKIYDQFVLAYDEAVSKEREAKRLVMVAQDKLEKAKPKPNFETQRPMLEAAIKDRDAAHIAATRAVETARHNREDQARKMREAKARLAIKSLSEWHASSVRLHEESLAALARHKEIITKLEQAPRDNLAPLPEPAVPATPVPSAAAAATAASAADASAARTAAGSGSRPASRPGTPRATDQPTATPAAPATATTTTTAPAPAEAASTPAPAAEASAPALSAAAAAAGKAGESEDSGEPGTGGADAAPPRRRESKA